MCVCVCVCTLPSRGLSTLVKELTAASQVMQSSSNELRTLLSGNAKCKQAKLIQNALKFPSQRRSPVGGAVRY